MILHSMMNQRTIGSLDKQTEKIRDDRSSLSSSPAYASMATSLEPNDVILGRGFRFAWHSGNNAFQALVKGHIDLYDAAKRKTDKSKIVQHIYDKVTSTGRFVKKDESTGMYFLVDEAAAKEKIGQAIRYKKRRSGNASPQRNSPMPSPEGLVGVAMRQGGPRQINLPAYEIVNIFEDGALDSVLGTFGEVEWPDLSQFVSLDAHPLFDFDDLQPLDLLPTALEDMEGEDDLF